MSETSSRDIVPLRAMQASALPLSGDVTQDILPWTWWMRFFGQWGLVNINLGRTPDPDGERRILEEVGSYGRQLGRLSDALEAVIGATLTKEDGTFDRDRLSDEQIAALVDFRELLEAVREVKERS